MPSLTIDRPNQSPKPMGHFDKQGGISPAALYCAVFLHAILMLAALAMRPDAERLSPRQSHQITMLFRANGPTAATPPPVSDIPKKPAPVEPVLPLIPDLPSASPVTHKILHPILRVRMPAPVTRPAVKPPTTVPTHEDTKPEAINAPPATTPVSGSHNPRRSEAPSVSGAWQSALASWLKSHKNYPDQARRMMQQGRVIVRFTVRRDGHVLSVAIADSAGTDILDQAALAVLRDADVPAFPETMPQEQVMISVPIRYRLDQ